MAVLLLKISILFMICFTEYRTQISNVPLTVNVYEDEISTVSLTEITCVIGVATDIRVSIETIEPNHLCGNCFSMLKLPSEANFKLFYVSGTGERPDYSVIPIYNISISCTDDTTTIYTTINVRVRTNEPPVFADFTATVTSVNAKTTKNGDILYTVPDATDPNPNDVVYYNMTVQPLSSANKYEIGLTDGIIRAKEDIFSECFPTLVFFIYITDNRTNVVGPKVVTVQFADYYTVPYISSLNKAISVGEDLAIGDAVGPVDITAVDNSGAIITYILDTFPITANYLFEMSSVSFPRILLRSKLNYESGLRNINITVEPYNTYCEPDIFFLYIEVVDANDPPVLTPRDQIVNIYEGDVNLNVGYSFNDEDLGDDGYFSINASSVSGVFSINHISGIITANNYDIDTGSPTQVMLVIEVEDTKGPATDATNLTINFLDANDNAPVFSSTSYSTSVMDCDPPGTPLGAVAASDPVDTAYNGNNVVECIPASNAYFALLSSCTLILTAQLPAGTVSILYIKAKDNGIYPGSLNSTEVPVILTSSACPTTTSTTTASTVATTTPFVPTTTTTTVPPTIGGIDSLPTSANGDDGATNNIWWIIMACIMALVGLLVGAFLVSRYIIPRLQAGSSSGQFRPNSGPHNKTSPARNNRNQRPPKNSNKNANQGNPNQNNQKPVSAREVRPFEPKQGGPDAYRLGQEGNTYQAQNNVWRGMDQQPGKGFNL